MINLKDEKTGITKGWNDFDELKRLVVQYSEWFNPLCVGDIAGVESTVYALMKRDYEIILRRFNLKMTSCNLA